MVCFPRPTTVFALIVLYSTDLGISVTGGCFEAKSRAATDGEAKAKQIREGEIGRIINRYRKKQPTKRKKKNRKQIGTSKTSKKRHGRKVAKKRAAKSDRYLFKPAKLRDDSTLGGRDMYVCMRW